MTKTGKFEVVVCDGGMSVVTREALNAALAQHGLELTEFRPGEWSDAVLVLHTDGQPFDEQAVEDEIGNA